MEHLNHARVRRSLVRVAALVSGLIGVSLPALYFFQGLASERSASAATLHAQATSISRVITRSPETWRFQESLLMEVLALRPPDANLLARQESVRVLAADGEVILASADVPAPPRLSRRTELSDSGQTAGYVEHIVGLRPLLGQSALVAALGTLLGILVFGVLRSLPLRAVDGALAALQAEVRRAEDALAEKAGVEKALRANEAELLRQSRVERLLEGLASASSAARTPEEALSSGLRQICEFTGWTIGHAALVTLDGEHAATRAAFWHRPEGEPYDRFVEASEGYRYDFAGGRFVGKALRLRAPVWVTELSAENGFMRADEYAAIGVRSGMAFPIIRGREAIGFFEFYSERPLMPDAELTTLVERAGVHVSGVIDRVEAADQIRRLNVDLERRVAERTEQSEQASAMLAARGRDAALLGEMTGVLQVAENLDEAGMLVARYLPVALQGTSGGGLYLMRASRDSLERLSTWGEASGPAGFPPSQCWGMRRGQPHGSKDGAVPLACAHLGECGAEGGSICLPLVAQGESLGLLQVDYAEAVDAERRAVRLAAAQRVTEQLSLALANVRLRDSLREQSIRDTLTGLHNRRFLEESLNRELARSARLEHPVALFMLDVDHFKRYNDNHGHDAGDAVLRELGRELRDSARAGDIVCRYGGEEFTIVLPGAGEDDARAWAERLLRNVRAMEVRLGSRALPSVTVSLGLAVHPLHGESAQVLLRAADAALYSAKREGRDRLKVVEACLPVSAPAHALAA